MAKQNGKKHRQESGGVHVSRSMSRPSSGGNLMRGGSPLSRLRSDFDRLFTDFLRGWGGLSAWSQERGLAWGLDVDDQEDKVIVRAEAPGFEPGDFDLQVTDKQLVLSAHQSQETEQDGGRHWRQQEFYRSVTLPGGVDAEHVDAQYRNGVLTVTMPKTQQGKSRHIEVKA